MRSSPHQRDSDMHDIVQHRQHGRTQLWMMRQTSRSKASSLDKKVECRFSKNDRPGRIESLEHLFHTFGDGDRT